MSSRIHIMCAADRAFLRHVPGMLLSVQENTNAELTVSVVSTDWNSDDQEKLKRALPRLDLHFHSLHGSELQGLSHKAVLSPLAYARLLMPEMVTADRFIYLDIDVTVRDDIQKLWRFDLGDAPAAAVFYGDDPRLNSGIMLVNAKLWRERSLSKIMLDWAHENRPKEADQDTLEAIIGNDVIHLDQRWNRLVDAIWGRSMLDQPGYFENAAILHFITGFKPWNLGSFFIPSQYYNEWKKYKRPNDLPIMWKHELKVFMWQVQIILKNKIFR